MKILVVDDHPLMRMGILSGINKHHPDWLAVEAFDGKEAILQTRSFMPDVILMDYDMPGIDGIKATLKIRHEFPNVKVILVSGHDNEEVIVSALKAGVDGIVPKHCPHRELFSAIEETMKGKKYLKGRALEFSREIKNNKNGKLTASNGLFTERETEVLKWIVKGITSKKISEILSISKRTVDNHRISLLKKSKTESTAALIRFAINSGFMEI
jgi:DNA-binding NarL/FixJ family response regulator